MVANYNLPALIQFNLVNGIGHKLFYACLILFVKKKVFLKLDITLVINMYEACSHIWLNSFSKFIQIQTHRQKQLKRIIFIVLFQFKTKESLSILKTYK